MVFSTWWSWLLALIVLSTVAMIIFSSRKGDREPAGSHDPNVIAGSKMVRGTRVIAWLYVAVCLVAGLTSVVEALWSDVVTTKLPVAEFWPTLPGNVTIDTPLATVEAGGFTVANVSVSGLDLQTRLMLAGSTIAGTALAVVAGLVVVKVCNAVLTKTLFAPRLIRGAQQLAGVVLLGGIIMQACEIFGGSMAAEQVLGASSWSIQGAIDTGTDIHNIVGMPAVAYSWDFNLWFIGVALVLMVLAELFRQGSKVQKDAAGLV